MIFDVWAKTDKGLKRESNQDSFLVNKDLGLFIVADGMGGHSGGEVASSLAVKAAEEVVMRLSGRSPREVLDQAYVEASRRIYDKAAQTRELYGMGTTMVMGLLRGSTFYIANVGDSRSYLFRNPHLWQVTEDHSLMNEQLRAGLITDEQTKTFLGKNVITRSVGYERDVVCDLQVGDTFMFCSDGLSGMVSDGKISDIFKDFPSHQWADRLIEGALAGGGEDNVTTLVVHFRA
jgi:PPM family protein phosphatase